jgi:ribulose-5-phosphate 4-epimerase/fuculose-1-phosphate aldolase
MSEENQMREQICERARSLYMRGLTCGASGNISVRLSDGRLLVTPTGSNFGHLDPARLTLFNNGMAQVSGDKPTKEMPLHTAFYETRGAKTGAVVHLHSCHSVALSVMPDTDPDNMIPAITPYGVMKLGKVKLLPYFMPGDPKMGDAIRGLAGKRSAVVLAHHGPVVAGKDLEAAVNAIEELEESAKLALLTRGLNPLLLDDAQINGLVTKFDVDWD